MRMSLRAGVLTMGTGLFAWSGTGCGPTVVHFDPSNAASIDVHPTSGKAEFCPGQAFQVELLVKLKNGSTCSNVDRARGCQGEEDAVLNPEMVRIEGTAGQLVGDPKKFLWEPPPDLFATAGSGLWLRGFLRAPVSGTLQDSVVGQAELTPVYTCRQAGDFGGGAAGAGQHGGAGPNIEVAIARLKTPYHPDAALVRVEVGGERFYYISAGPTEQIRITTHGADGGTGDSGPAGQPGEAGRAGSGQCANGENGRDGTDGGAGGPGGDGGPGGQIRVVVDKASADALKGRIIAQSHGGAAGAGGAGGPGGSGGSGGSPGPSGPQCSGQKGQDGRQGRTGTVGPSGRPGQDGPPPSFATSSRDKLFADEMSMIQRIESAKREKPVWK